jgi:hypothetical protein
VAIEDEAEPDANIEYCNGNKNEDDVAEYDCNDDRI